MNENMEWLKDLKPGDEIAIDQSSTWNKNVYSIKTVEKITPSGRIKLNDGSQYFPDGREYGGNHYRKPLRQVTPEIREAVKCRELLYKINPDKFLKKLNSEQLGILLEWQNAILESEKE